MKNVALFLINVIFSFQFGYSQMKWTLDQNFGLSGVSSYNLVPGHEEISAIALQPDGKIVSIGITDGYKKILLTRFLQNGSIDSSFGENGIIQFGPGTMSNYPVGFGIQKDGVIVLIGMATMLDCTAFYFITRLFINGEVDHSYTGEADYLMIDPTLFQNIGSLLVMSDNSIVIGGGLDLNQLLVNINFSFLKINPELTKSNVFWPLNPRNIDIKNLNHDRVIEMAECSSKGIYAIGASIATDQTGFDQQRIAIVKLDSMGIPVTDFGENGKVFHENETMIFHTAVACTKDDALLLLGGVSMNPEGEFSGFELRKYKKNGQLDTDFGEGGRSKLKLFTTNYSNYYSSMLVQNDGKILLAGQITVPYPIMSSCLLARFNENGTLDTTFGDKGKLVTDLGNPVVITSLTFDQSGKKIIAGVVGPCDENQDYCSHLIKYLNDFNVGYFESSANTQDWLVYPNPVKDKMKITLTLNDPGQLSITLFDYRGQMVTRFLDKSEFGSGSIEQELSLPENLEAGLYLLELKYGNSRKSVNLLID